MLHDINIKPLTCSVKDQVITTKVQALKYTLHVEYINLSSISKSIMPFLTGLGCLSIEPTYQLPVQDMSSQVSLIIRSCLARTTVHTL